MTNHLSPDDDLQPAPAPERTEETVATPFESLPVPPDDDVIVTDDEDPGRDVAIVPEHIKN